MSNKVYMNNFSSLFQNLTIEEKNTKNVKNFLVGFDNQIDNLVFKQKTINDFIQNLLIYEKIFISIFDINYLVMCFGVDNILNLLSNNVLKLVDDKNMKPALLKENGRYVFTNLTLEENSLEELEKIYKKLNKNFDRKKLNKFMLQIEKNIIYSNMDSQLGDLFGKEMKYDLKNQNYILNTELISTQIDKINYQDVRKVLRMGFVNKSLSISNIIKVDNIHVDGWAKEFMNYKLSPVFQDKSFINVNEIFTDLINKKSIPNLGELYLKGIITLEDILEVRSNINGQTFRYRFNSINYNQEEAWKEILNKKSTFSSNILKTMRFIIPNIVGLVNTPLGIAMGAVDSFIVNKILDGWSPQLFLDNQLKKKIDEKIEFNEKINEKKKSFRKVS